MLLVSIFLLLLVSATSACDEKDHAELGWIFTQDRQNGDTTTPVYGDLDAKMIGNGGVKADGGMKFDGNTYVSVPGANTNNIPSQEITLESWVKVSKGTRWGGIIGFFQDNGNYEQGWVLTFHETQMGVAVATTSTGQLESYLYGFDFDLGQYHHVVGRYDGALLTLWVDGRMVGSKRMNGKIQYPPRTNMYIGTYKDQDEHFNLVGEIHSTFIYDRAISNADIIRRNKMGKNKSDKFCGVTTTMTATTTTTITTTVTQDPKIKELEAKLGELASLLENNDPEKLETVVKEVAVLTQGLQAVDASLSTHKTALESVSSLVEAQSKSLAAAMARIEELEAWKANTAEIIERVPMVESNLLSVKATFEDFKSPPLRQEAGQPPACASTNDCPAPTLEAAGDGSMSLVAKNGPIKFDCPSCNGTDVGKIVRDLDALLAKFGDGH